MSHDETKKKAKKQDSKSQKPETIQNGEIKKHTSKGVIKGTE